MKTGTRTEVPTASATEDLGVTAEEIAERKHFLDFTEEDIRRLTDLAPLASAYAVPVIEAFYDHLLQFDVGRRFFRDPALLEHVKRRQMEYFLGLTNGDYGPGYVEERLRIGIVHERIGLPHNAYLGMYAFYLRAAFERIFAEKGHDPGAALLDAESLLKIVFFDLGLAIDTYMEHRERTILNQQQAIQELPTPVLRLRKSLLLVPIVGLLDSTRARQLTDQLLRSIAEERARAVVLDITGVQEVDSGVADHLVKTMKACRLMGAKVIISGISPEVAHVLVGLGVDLGGFDTTGDLQSGMDLADSHLGYRVVQDGPNGSHDDEP